MSLSGVMDMIDVFRVGRGILCFEAIWKDHCFFLRNIFLQAAASMWWLVIREGRGSVKSVQEDHLIDLKRSFSIHFLYFANT